MSLQTYRLAQAWLAEQQPAIVVTVTASQGSAPRDAGARMVVSLHSVSGTVGGGHLEWRAIDHARAILLGQSAQPSLHFPLGPALGQCCGGAVTLGFAPLDAAALAGWPPPSPLFHLQLYGAGHVGRSIARLLSTLDVEVDWVDEREEEFPSALFEGAPWPAHIRRVCVDAVEAEVAIAPAGAFYLVLTHNHDLDLRITQAILARGDFAYFGLIGSRTKRMRFEHRLERHGFASDLVKRMTCPIGVPGIDGKQPEVIAVAVVAQLLQHAKRSPHGEALKTS